jgi:hypothetical protein
MPISCVAMTDGPWQMLHVLSRAEPNSSANSTPTRCASLVEELQPNSRGYLASVSIWAADHFGLAHGAAVLHLDDFVVFNRHFDVVAQAAANGADDGFYN